MTFTVHVQPRLHAVVIKVVAAKTTPVDVTVMIWQERHVAHTFIDSSSLTKPRWRRPFINTAFMSVIIIAVAVLAVFAWFFTATHVTDLGEGHNMSRSGLYARWVHGDVVVMIRHAERCDRSANLCMGSADGITVSGGDAALAVGAGLRRLGLVNARMIASPTTRTRQTANLIAGHAVGTQPWVSDCDSGFKDAVLAHKTRGENLVLMTHSGCIDQFERKMGVPAWERSSDYAQALFVHIDGSGRPEVLGSLNSRQWQHLKSDQ